MAQLLKEVKSTNDKGLVGITEAGEEVALSAPKPGAWILSKDELIKKVDDKFYIHFGDEIGGAYASKTITYNLYTRRK